MEHSFCPIDNVPRETLNRLFAYREILEKWRSHINLVGNSEDAWERHIIDSAQLFSLIPDKKSSLADFGTGAGFPGMVLAIMGMPYVHLVESDTKKIVFLREVARLTKTDVAIQHLRIEDLGDIKFDIITSRALAPLDKLFAYASPHFHVKSFCLFPKGKNYSIELSEARKMWRFESEEKPSQSGEGIILIIRNLRKKEGGEWKKN